MIIQPEMVNRHDIENIHAESLRILDKIGIVVESEEVSRLLCENGAHADSTGKILRLPAKLVMNKLDRAVRAQRSSYGLSKEQSIGLQGWMSESNIPKLLDYTTQRTRKGTLGDMLHGIVLGNNLSNIARISCLVRECTSYGRYSSALNYYLLYLYSKKRYFMGTIDSLRTAQCVVAMARIACDNERQLRDGRLVEFELEAKQNLVFGRKELGIALEFAKNNIKVQPGGWFWMGYHTPNTFAAALALSNANILAAICIVMLINPDSPKFAYLFGTQSVMKNGDSFPSFGSPNQALFALAGNKLAHFYGFEDCIANVGLSDSRDADFQSGFERGTTAAIALIAGVRKIGLQGVVGADRAVSYEELVLDNEMLSYLNYIYGKEIKVDAKMLKRKMIKQIGRGGIVTRSDHEELAEETWSSDIFAPGGKALVRAATKVKKIFEQGFPPKAVLEKQKVTELNKVLKSYIRDAAVYGKLQRELLNLVGG